MMFCRYYPQPKTRTNTKLQSNTLQQQPRRDQKLLFNQLPLITISYNQFNQFAYFDKQTVSLVFSVYFIRTIIQIQMQPSKNLEYYMALPSVKTVQNKYQIKNLLLGEGTFAKTYLAINTQTNQLLACKMISKQELLSLINKYESKNSAKNYFIKALKNQMDTWKKLKHKNIVVCEDVLETASNIYFLLQYCNDGTLLKYIKKGKLPYNEAIRIFKEIVEGCVYLYNLNIFHRDLKPQNILIKDGTIKISDFGFAKPTGQSQKDLPEKGTVAGTPIYMAPQILNGQPYSLKCDVWSLGVIFYQLLFGLLPWDDIDEKDKLMKHIQQPIQFPPSQPIPNEVKQIIRCMLTVDEANRIGIVGVKEMLDKIDLGGGMDIQQ